MGLVAKRNSGCPSCRGREDNSEPYFPPWAVAGSNGKVVTFSSEASARSTASRYGGTLLKYNPETEQYLEEE